MSLNENWLESVFSVVFATQSRKIANFVNLVAFARSGIAISNDSVHTQWSWSGVSSNGCHGYLA